MLFRRLFVPLLAALVLPLTLLVGTPKAFAHDQLVGTTPSNGSTVAPPTSVTLTFAEAAVQTGTRVTVTGPSGAADGTTKVNGSAVVTTFDAPLAAGHYTVVWRVTSADGHPVNGTFAFTVTGGSSSVSSSAASSSELSSATVSTSDAASASTSVALTQSSEATPPAQQVPTDKTNNYPALVIGGAVVALLLIAAAAVVARKRLTDD